MAIMQRICDNPVTSWRYSRLGHHASGATSVVDVGPLAVPRALRAMTVLLAKRPIPAIGLPNLSDENFLEDCQRPVHVVTMSQ